MGIRIPLGTAQGAPAATCFGKPVTMTGRIDIQGTNGNDVIMGSPADDKIQGNARGSGDDKMTGGGGDDLEVDDAWVPNGGQGHRPLQPSL